MSRAIRIMGLLAICLLCTLTSHLRPVGAENGLADSQEKGLTIELSGPEITASSLRLDYTIRNGSDHEVWVCSELSKNSSKPYEIFLAPDQQTLLIRKRLDVPSVYTWRRRPAPGEYVRLNAGAALTESLLIDLLAKPIFLFSAQSRQAVTQTAHRLALETGYYDEDLVALVRSILAVADQLSAEGWRLDSKLDPSVGKTYFRGLGVRSNLSGFDTINEDPEGKGLS
jgi:hypothetical protein